MDTTLDNGRLHQILQEQELVDILQGFQGQAAADFEIDVEQFGADVRKSVDTQLINNLGNPLDATDRVIGYIALLYEAENNETIEEAINPKVTSTGE